MYFVISFVLCPLEPVTCSVKTCQLPEARWTSGGHASHTDPPLNHKANDQAKPKHRVLLMLEDVDDNCLLLLSPHKAAIVLHDFH